MAEVFFYHLTRTPLEVSLPDLLEKSMARGWRVQVMGAVKDRLEWLDKKLWTTRDDSFLPHGLAEGPHDELQPVLLGTSEVNKNQAQVLMVIDGADVSAGLVSEYERVCVIFDGNDPKALDQARGQWKDLTDAGLAAKYWSQESGSWQEKASRNL